MKHSKLILILFVLVFGVTASGTFVINYSSIHKPIRNQSIAQYTEHTAITILNDTDFGWQAGNESWQGEGSSDQPYIIEGLNITADGNCIQISDVRVHFIIRDCLLTSINPGSGNGMDIYNATNFIIEDSMISENDFGVHLLLCQNVTFNNNTIHSNLDDGIYIEESSYCTLILNRIYDSYTGIYGEDCSYVNVTDNTFYLNGYQAIYARIGTNWTIVENTIFDNDFEGVYLWNIDYGIISHNEIYNSTYNGIQMYFSENCTIEDNVIHDNGWYEAPMNTGSGVYTRDAEGVRLIDNQLYNNSMHGAYIRDSSNNIIEGNTVYSNYGLLGEGCGIYLSNADETSIIDNIAYNNTQNGITGWYADNCTYTNNMVYDNTMDGFDISYSVNCTLETNVVYDNGGYGIQIANGDNNFMIANDLGWNYLGNALDDAGDNYWNTTVGNYWSDYEGQQLYTIAGSGDAIDYHPWYNLLVGIADALSFEQGQTGNTLTWNSSAANPGVYDVLDNGVSFESQPWDGAAININVDGLDVGYHNVTLIVYHISGHFMSSTTYVNVTAPIVTTTTTTCWSCGTCSSTTSSSIPSSSTTWSCTCSTPPTPSTTSTSSESTATQPTDEAAIVMWLTVGGVGIVIILVVIIVASRRR